MLLIGAVLGATPAIGETVIVTETGTVMSLRDALGAFGAPGANLAGQTITNVYTFTLPPAAITLGSFGTGDAFESLFATTDDLDTVTSTIGGNTISIFGTEQYDTEQATSPPGPVQFSRTDQTAVGHTQPTGGLAIFLAEELISPDLIIPLAADTPYDFTVNNPESSILGGGVIFIHGTTYADGLGNYNVPEFGWFSESSINVNVPGVDIGGGGTPFPPPSPAPEPATWMTLLLGIFGLGAALRIARKTLPGVVAAAA